MEQLFVWLGGYIWLTAFVLGAFHALQPGHGKTIVAAYLVGARGTVKDAVLLGIVVTLTHTLTIYLLAGLAQAGALFLPLEEIGRSLGALASLLIVLVGALMIAAQWRRTGRTAVHGADGQQAHAGLGHSHAGHDHSHSPHGHDHAHVHLPGIPHHHPDPAGMTSLSKVVMLGISGGIVPCPEGLAVFLASVAGGQLEKGVLLVVVFSLGLAATLVAVGILFLKASRLFKTREAGSPWPDRVAWTSALLITAVGAAYFSRYLYQFYG